ncbi:MAG: hypothetical protein M0R30_10720 [Methanoregula sp.]|jgi:hypothetical protein|uniref:hypothetical protein n=1 Tax=Methanoregula sp. TaxID=2052170 RepID=UPI0025FCF05B|nr:hypothetical protein [Methanoregula sp.]MCK9632101.1 hypothetical protein [Methanoregula sp.]
MSFRWRKLLLIFLGLLIVYISICLLITSTGSYGKGSVTGPDKIVYRVTTSGSLDNPFPSDKGILIPTVVNESGALVFSDQDLTYALSSAYSCGGDTFNRNSYGKSSYLNLSYVDAENGTMILVRPNSPPAGKEYTISFCLEKENAIGNKFLPSPQIAASFFPSTVTTIVYNPIHNKPYESRTSLLLEFSKAGDTVTHGYMSDPIQNFKLTYGYNPVVMSEYGQYSEWAKFIWIPG